MNDGGAALLDKPHAIPGRILRAGEDVIIGAPRAARSHASGNRLALPRLDLRNYQIGDAEMLGTPRRLLIPRLGHKTVVGFRQDGTPLYLVEGAAVSALWYGSYFLSVNNKEVDIDSDTIKAALCTSSYTPDQDAHRYYSSITNELTTTGGYTLNGLTLTTPSSTYTGATNVWAIDFDDAVWSAATFTARYCPVYDRTPATDATRPLIMYVDFGGDQTVSSGTFTVVWAAGGLAKVTVS